MAAMPRRAREETVQISARVPKALLKAAELIVAGGSMAIPSTTQILEIVLRDFVDRRSDAKPKPKR